MLTGYLLSNGVSLSSVAGAFLVLVGHLSSDGVAMKIPYGVDVLLHWLALHPIFSYCVG